MTRPVAGPPGQATAAAEATSPERESAAGTGREPLAPPVTSARAAVWRWRIGPIRGLLRPRVLAVLTAALAVVALAAVIALGHGPNGAGVVQLPALLADPDGSVQARVAAGIRLPRIVTAIAVGALLGAAGAVTQSLTRNALGSPEILGLTAGSSTGAVAALILGADPLLVGVSACLGGAGTAALVLVLARRHGTLDPSALILSGIGAGALLQGATAAMLVRAHPETALVAQIWLVGSVNARTWTHAAVAAGALAVTIPLLLLGVRHLDALDAGDEHARQLGVRVDQARACMGIVAVLMTSVAVAVAGPIGFVSLIAPQVARRLLGLPGASVVTSAAIGSGLLLGGDVAALALPVAGSTPVGATTGVLGGLYLLVLLRKGARR